MKLLPPYSINKTLLKVYTNNSNIKKIAIARTNLVLIERLIIKNFSVVSSNLMADVSSFLRQWTRMDSHRPIHRRKWNPLRILDKSNILNNWSLMTPTEREILDYAWWEYSNPRKRWPRRNKHVERNTFALSCRDWRTLIFLFQINVSPWRAYQELRVWKPH